MSVNAPPQKVNYQRQLDAILAQLAAAGKRPRLLLHACCAPCASYCVPYLAAAFDVTVYYYNPNIAPKEEYELRLAELRRLLAALPLPAPVSLIEAPYDPDAFARLARGREAMPEGGSRCRDCYALRLDAAAKAAADGGYDWFCTTLSISPHKNADWLNAEGQLAAARYGVPFLPSDFKKKGGYAASIQLSRQYGLYRQNYCGCVFSAAEAAARDAARTAAACCSGPA